MCHWTTQEPALLPTSPDVIENEASSSGLEYKASSAQKSDCEEKVAADEASENETCIAAGDDREVELDVAELNGEVDVTQP